MTQPNQPKDKKPGGLTPSDASHAPGDGYTIPLGPDSGSAVEPQRGKRPGPDRKPLVQDSPRINE